MSQDVEVRTQAFEWLREQVDRNGDVLPWSILSRGFTFRGVRVPLASQQGIFKPRVMSETPLSIRTSPNSPYDDRFRDGFLSYAYRGDDPQHRDNVGLRQAYKIKAPLIYLMGIVPGHYLVAWPVFVVGDDPARLEFAVALDDAKYADPDLVRPFVGADPAGENARREYITTSFRRRVHQRSFRERVLQAYRDRCALCRLKHRKLLDAAHITPDADPAGEPVVSNGIALCKLHHAAYDGLFLAISPDYRIEIRADILEEEDGPMLLHGLKGTHMREIILPKSQKLRPDPDRLAKRYEQFLAAAR